jgi:hypothetical protein
MILVTTGALLPFDRLIAVMDDWAARHPQTELFAQIGDGRYLPRHMPYLRMEDRCRSYEGCSLGDAVRSWGCEANQPSARSPNERS